MDRFSEDPDLYAWYAAKTVANRYVFDFLELAEDARERQLEQALIDDIQNFLSVTRPPRSSRCIGYMLRSPCRPGRPEHPSRRCHRSKSQMMCPAISPSSPSSMRCARG
jgi:hypothetical protein